MPMIADPRRTTVLSSLGWVDGDALWRFDVANGQWETLPLDRGARYATLHSSGSDRFVIAHRFDGARFELSVRSFASPLTVLAGAVVSEGERTLFGEAAAWRDVPHLYVESLAFAPWKDFVLIKLAPGDGALEVQTLAWYDDRYDKLYQGVGDVLDLPGRQSALVAVQRSSQLVVHDLQTGLQTGMVDLGGGLGAQGLELRQSEDEVWASDYDAIVVLSAEDFRILRRARLQEASDEVGQFIGDFSFAPDDDVCCVARPFSGDVVAIDTASLAIRGGANLGRQPLEVMALPRGEVIARDWQTGDLLRGKLRR